MADDWKPATFRDRVTELRRVAASDLKPHPMNWREHPPEQKLALRGVLKEIGFAGAELAYVADADKGTPDAPLTLIDGHARREEVGNQVVPVLVLDLTDDEANKLLATFDPLGAMAEANKGQLKALLDTLTVSDEYIAALLTDLAAESGIIPDDKTPTELKPLTVMAPPAMTWVLVGIPTVRFGEINQQVEAFAGIDGIILETTSNDG